MLRRLAAEVTGGAEALVKLHPAELVTLLEQIWNLRMHPAPTDPQPLPQAGHPGHRSDVPGLEIREYPIAVSNPPRREPRGQGPVCDFDNVLGGVLNQERSLRGAMWDHLIYAYMIENTRIYEIFRRVVYEFLHGEKLGAPSADSHLWLRSTEELFYRDSPPFSVTTLTSYLRPDLGGTRRNAYHRMFGMELNHGRDDNSPYPYARADAANKEFVTTFEELLREVWVGHINRKNAVGTKPTDDSKIEELARKLHDMLITRRLNGNLAREEFFFVAMMSWFHLTVDNNLPIIRDLRADASSAEERLFKIAQLVGLPAHGLSRSYFLVAEAMSEVLIAIETGRLHQEGAAVAFYDPEVPDIFDASRPNVLPGKMNLIITHWSIITGHDVKAGKVAIR